MIKYYSTKNVGITAVTRGPRPSVRLNVPEGACQSKLLTQGVTVDLGIVVHAARACRTIQIIERFCGEANRKLFRAPISLGILTVEAQRAAALCAARGPRAKLLEGRFRARRGNRALGDVFRRHLVWRLSGQEETEGHL